MDQYIGRLLDDRYEILEMIGSGGMAVVYKARCHRLNRLVAIKILKDEFSGDEEFRRRFRAEGEAVAMLSHPNIVQVYDVGSCGDSNYIVMELIDGISLKQYMEKKGVLNWKETLHFAMQIAQGLEHAHSRGIIHRDIKPHNIMVLKNGSVKVMDFGIARVMSKTNTLTKEALGSVHYISPEQAKGGYTDNRSDIYSLSVVMYEMMTGRPPYDGESPVAVAIQHINGGAPRPSTLNPNIPAGLEQIIMKGMALEVNDRYVSATEMLQDMEQFRQNPGVRFHYRSALNDATQPVPVSGIHGQTPVRKPPVRNPNAIRKHGANVVDANSESMRRVQQRRKAEQERKAQEKSRFATVAIVVCSAVVVISIVVFLIALFNGALLNQEKDLVEVPYLVGEIYTEDYAYEYGDFTIRLQEGQYSDTYASGMVMRQEPTGGSKVLKGTELWLTVSMGEKPEEKKMINVVAAELEEGKSTIQEVLGEGFKFLVRKEDSATVKEGLITRTEPAAGATLTQGDLINIWVSNGPPIVEGEMPNVVGQTREEALRLLSEQGFETVTVEEVDSKKPAGTVIYQSVAKHERIDVETKIVLEVSLGPKETEETKKPVQNLFMPEVLNLHIDIAKQELTRVGLNLDQVTIIEVESSRDKGRVVVQEPRQGQLVSTEDPIVLQVSLGPGETARAKITFALPNREEGYLLTVKLDGKQVADTVEIQPGQTQYTVEMSGKGTQTCELYIDGDLYQSQEVNFSE